MSLERGSATMLSFGNFLHLHGYRLNITTQETLEVRKEIQCSSMCLKKHDCFSFNVEKKNSERFLCEFLNSSKYLFPKKLKQEKNFVHWYLQVTCYTVCQNILLPIHFFYYLPCIERVIATKKRNKNKNKKQQQQQQQKQQIYRNHWSDVVNLCYFARFC